ncbi:MAG: PTS lactose/cellobiose transporter subunit IIA [Aerococcus sp.]|nr:PTS lactose/cellobiose transporter subunit IIA [Aerococcus sp.]
MTEPNTTLEQTMMLIVHAGNAKSLAMEAIQAAKQHDFQVADTKLKEADKAILEAHHIQTQMLTSEASGDDMPLSLLLVHSQDHLMTAITFIDLAKEHIELRRELATNRTH